MEEPQRSYVSERTRVSLAFRSGGRCAICKNPITLKESDESMELANAAHISDKNPGSERYNSGMTDEERNHQDNLIYLCRNCHGRIDAFPKKFPVEKLMKIKQDHEQEVKDALVDKFTEIGFAELEKVTQWVKDEMPNPTSASRDLSLLKIEEKIRKNNLTDDAVFIIEMAYFAIDTVKEYIQSVSQDDSDFPERLKLGFLNQYFKYRQEGIRDQDLFDKMRLFSSQNSKTQKERIAGIAVLVYLFGKCEVFKK